MQKPEERTDCVYSTPTGAAVKEKPEQLLQEKEVKKAPLSARQIIVIVTVIVGLIVIADIMIRKKILKK